MNKKEAAEFLGLSEKTVERYKAKGKLSARSKRVIGDDGKSRTVLDFKESDLERLKRELSNEVVFPIVTDGHAQTKTCSDKDNQTHTDSLTRDYTGFDIVSQTQTVRLLEAIFERFKVISKPSTFSIQKPFLTDDEASEISGLPKSFIRKSRKNKTLPFFKAGNKPRIRLSDLEKFVNNL